MKSISIKIVIAGSILFSHLAFGHISAQYDTSLKQKLAPSAAIVYVDEQPTCITFNKNSTKEWQDIIQDESMLELCNQVPDSSQELQNFAQSFYMDTVGDDTEYAFLSHLAAGAGGCILGVGSFMFGSSLTSGLNDTNDPPSEISTIATGGIIAGLGSALLGDMTGHAAVGFAGTALCFGGISVLFLSE